MGVQVPPGAPLQIFAKYFAMIVKRETEKQYWQLIKDIGSFNDRWDENIQTKSDIFSNLIKNLKSVDYTILFLNFNPIALKLAETYSVTIVCDSNLQDIFDFSKVKKVVSSIDQLTEKFNFVIGLDEYFTYADSELNQRSLVESSSKLTNGWLITTLQDYKNFAPHKKNQIDAIAVNSGNNYIMLENSLADKFDKQLWNHYWYCIKDHKELLTIGPIERRTMYFKQLAKYSSDAGGFDYLIQKNLLYKGFFSKGFEHIITVKF